MIKPNKLTGILIIYCIIFYAIWAVWELCLNPQMTEHLQNPWLSNLLGDGIVKNLVWTLPAFLLMGKYAEHLQIPRKEMCRMKVNWLPWIPWLLLFFVYAAANPLLMNGHIGIAKDFHPSDFVWLAVVGITEESVFRGWLLNATIGKNNQWKAILLNALAFLAIHFPIWIHNGIFVSAFTSLGFVQIIALSILFSWSFVKTRSIAVPIILHVAYDLAVTVIG
ncbi:MAG: CPBP family intramembrane metalloprotease [Oscillospiraceae bacterium]|nr:CPBP family intramembrane metalloprotease [Oscillospiraceae bacterium]MBR4101484.1 CPBP family intramembrane metalloprotease [Oscillospiraceae bacterium]